MQFEWDENKNKANKRKHGIRFETAALIFQDPCLLSVVDITQHEERWRSLGLLQDCVIYVAHTVKEDEYGEEIIRIISARAATPNETRSYFLHCQNGQRTS